MDARNLCDFYAEYSDSEEAAEEWNKKEYLRNHPLQKIEYFQKTPDFNGSFVQAGVLLNITFVFLHATIIDFYFFLKPYLNQIKTKVNQAAVCRSKRLHSKRNLNYSRKVFLQQIIFIFWQI